MTVAIAHVFAVPAQCQAHHGECHINVYGPKQILSLEGRLCRDCLFVDAINALPCCLFHRCFVFRRWYRGCNVNRIAIAISWIAPGIFVFSRCSGYEKAVDFFSCRPPHCPDQSTLLLSFCYSTGGMQARRLIRRIGLHSFEVEHDTL